MTERIRALNRHCRGMVACSRARGVRAAIVAVVTVLAGSGVAGFAVVGPAEAAGGAVKPKPGFYLGSIGAYTLTFTVAAGGTTITNLTTDFQGNGGGCMPAPEVVQTKFAPLTIQRASFHTGKEVHFPSGISEHFTIQGKFASTTIVRGKINNSYTITSLPPCNDTQPFSATYVGPNSSSAVSSFKVTSAAGKTATFKNVSADFGSLVTPTATPKLHNSGLVWVFLQATTLSSAQSAALKQGADRSASLHLVIAGSSLIDTTYKFSGAKVVSLSSPQPGSIVVELSYTTVTSG